MLTVFANEFLLAKSKNYRKLPKNTIRTIYKNDNWLSTQSN